MGVVMEIIIETLINIFFTYTGATILWIFGRCKREIKYYINEKFALSSIIGFVVLASAICSYFVTIQVLYISNINFNVFVDK